MPVANRPKPLLVGEANPYGGDPSFALYPAPDGCSGHNLCHKVLGMYRKDYLEAFERANLCPHHWDMRAARRRAQELRTYKGILILLGSKVARAFEFNPFEPFTIQDGGKTLILPHPSGLCRYWDDLGNIYWARKLVAQVAPQVADLLERGSSNPRYDTTYDIV